MKISTAKETLKILAMSGVVSAVMFGGAVLNIIYHGSIPEVMIPGFRIMIGLATLGTLIFAMALYLDNRLSKKVIANRRKNRLLKDEKSAKDYAFQVKWSSIIRTVLHTQP